jgi:hypothetical protein
VVPVAVGCGRTGLWYHTVPGVANKFESNRVPTAFTMRHGRASDARATLLD